MGHHIIITPSHICDPSIAIAAIRAGETGILDLGYGNSKENILRSLDRLDQLAGNRNHWGVRWDTLGDPSRSPDTLKKYIGTPIPTIILAGVSPPDMEESSRAAHRYFRKVLLEVTTLKAAQAAQKAGFDGVIVKGNEAGGYTGSESSFILVQQLNGKMDIPYWVWGGMGLHTTAAARLAGAEGGIFCEQLWLADESPFSMDEKKIWKNMDGSETICLGHTDIFFRLYTRTGRKKIREYEMLLAKSDNWRSAMNQLLLDSNDKTFIPCGQDLGMASQLAEKFGTVGGILSAIEKNFQGHISEAKKHRSFSKGSPLAQVHGTPYPIVQGPMANVSDVARFSKEIAREGGLPFVALAAMPGPQIRSILEEMHYEMEGLNWGVGTLGFLPASLRSEQFQVIKEFKPPFAIIAGGRPSLAMDYETEGISTYLHVPTPGLLSQFIKKGATRFIFEGRECGGHVGPLSSFILWESAINRLLARDIADPEQLQVLFAGGIHDALSSAMVQVLASPLAASGIKFGLLMGSAYLFSNESVMHGAITPEYQKQALACRTTHLLQSGIGHASCCIETPFIEKFYAEKQKLILSGKTDAEILHELELMNLGRLKLASKGVSYSYKESDKKDHLTHIQVEQIKVDDETQRNEGVFMIGQVARFHDKTYSIMDLHTDVSVRSLGFLETSLPASRADESIKTELIPSHKNEDIAVIGMGCFLPEANNFKEYWQNILNLVCAIREIPEDRWIIDDYFEPDRQSSEKTYSKWGGFLKDILFDPIKYSMAPKSLESIDSTQLLALEVAGQALNDAGYHKPGFPRKRTAVIFGAGGINRLGMDYGGRVMAPHFAGMAEGIPEDLKGYMLASIMSKLPKWTSDSFPGVLANVIAGRITNRFDLGGMNFTCDAACASSFAAMDIAIRQLRTHACDAALVGAVDAGNHPLEYVMFSRSQALSPTGNIRPLDDRADGIVLSEGTAAVVLKRLSDAERDGDQIYAVIKGVGGSSDGRNKSLVAPNSEGQVRAMKAAYEDAGVEPGSVELLEMHGTGTVVGDNVEMQSYRELFTEHGMKTNHCAVGSVKSMIGHTKITAGLAALIKTSLALKHKILPPTMGVETPNTKIDFSSSPFYVNTEARPWIADNSGDTRKAGLSCFGFGGCNFHIVMEEYTRKNRNTSLLNLIPRDAEIFTFSAPTRSDLQKRVHHLLGHLQVPGEPDLSQLAYCVFLDSSQVQPENPGCRLNIVATSLTDLEHKLNAVQSDIDGGGMIRNSPGIYYSEGTPTYDSTGPYGPVCFLFPGQGSQKINMFRDLVLSMPETYDLIQMADRLTEGSYDRPLSDYIYPTPVFSGEERRRQQEELNQSHVAQPSMGLINLVASDILQSFGIEPDMVAGHSYGEYVALCAAGSLSRKDLIRLSASRGEIIRNFSTKNTGTMAAVQADSKSTSHFIDTLGLNVSIANYNSPSQTVISGSVEAIDKAVTSIDAEGVRIKKIPVTAAFHTNAMTGISLSLNEKLKDIDLKKPETRAFSNTTSLPYPESPDEIRHLLKRHICEPVQFEKMIQNMYAEGARLFIEVGPGRVLTALVESILGDAPFTAVSMDVSGRSGWHQLSHLLAQVKTTGLPIDLSPCFKGRGLDRISTDDLIRKTRDDANPGPMTWRIFGGHAEPFHPTHKEKTAPRKKRAELKILSRNEAPPESRTRHVPLSPEAIVPPPVKENKERVVISQKKTMPTARSARVNIINNNTLNILEQCNITMAHFFEMQCEQHRTTQRFINMQETMIEMALHGRIDGNKSEKPAIPEQIHLTPVHHEQPVFVTQAVPPTPTLPTLREVPQAAAEPDTMDKVSLYDAPPVPTEPESSVAPIATIEPERPLDPVATIEPLTDSKKETNDLARFPDADEFRKNLVKITSEHTGFPEDMLDLSMNMEADLGIDSIKKLEIFSTLDEKYKLMESGNEELIIEELAAITSLEGIIKWYEKKREDHLNSAEMTSDDITSAKK